MKYQDYDKITDNILAIYMNGKDLNEVIDIISMLHIKLVYSIPYIEDRKQFIEMLKTDLKVIENGYIKK